MDATWDPGPCRSPPLKIQCESSTPNWRRKKAKSSGSSPAGWYSASVGLGRREASRFCPQPCTCTDSQGPLLRRTSATAPQRQIPAGPAPLLGAENQARKPAWRSTRGRSACPAKAAEPAPRAVREPCPHPLLPHTLLCTRRLGWVSGGRVPIMNEQSRGWRGAELRARPPACARGASLSGTGAACGAPRRGGAGARAPGASRRPRCPHSAHPKGQVDREHQEGFWADRSGLGT